MRRVNAAQLGQTGYSVGTAEFEGQESGAWLAHPNSFLRTNNAVNLVNTPPASVQLRVSDGNDLAVEDTNIDIRQARVCFASDACISKNNNDLRTASSSYRLGKMLDGNNAARWIRIAGTMLYQVQMVKTPDDTPYASDSNNCNDVAGEMMGVKVNHQRAAKNVPRVSGAVSRLVWKVAQQLGNRTVPQWVMDNQPALRIAQYACTYAEATGADQGNAFQVALAAAEGVLTDGEIAKGHSDPASQAQQIANYIQNTLRLDRRFGGPRQGQPQRRFIEVCQHLGINEWADPLPGEAFYTTSIAGLESVGRVWQAQDHATTPPTLVRPCLEYHWGAVVAKQGDDRIVFEDYARQTEDDNASLASPGHRGFFEMYQVPRRTTQGQTTNSSWHHTWKPQGFANPLTIAVKRLR